MKSGYDKFSKSQNAGHPVDALVNTRADKVSFKSSSAPSRPQQKQNQQQPQRPIPSSQHSQSHRSVFDGSLDASQKPRPNLNRSTDSRKMAEDLRRKLRPQMKKAKAPPYASLFLSVVGFVCAAFGVYKVEQIEKWVDRIEVSVLGSAHAEATPEAAKPTAATAAVAPAKAGEAAKTETAATSAAVSAEVAESDYFVKFQDRKQELDAREAELARQEEELKTQKAELDKKIEELDKTRREISSVLEEKVKGDTVKVETLVQVYSTMKPQQAAKILETMDENLAVEILGQMKKKNAAEVMNMMKPEKVQAFTEKYAGYKKK